MEDKKIKKKKGSRHYSMILEGILKDVMAMHGKTFKSDFLKNDNAIDTPFAYVSFIVGILFKDSNSLQRVNLINFFDKYKRLSKYCLYEVVDENKGFDEFLLWGLLDKEDESINESNCGEKVMEVLLMELTQLVDNQK